MGRRFGVPVCAGRSIGMPLLLPPVDVVDAPAATIRINRGAVLELGCAAMVLAGSILLAA